MPRPCPPAATALASALAVALLLSACASAPQAPTSAAEVGEQSTGLRFVSGYLPRTELPDSLALVPPPPAKGSAAQADDDEAYRALAALRSGPRGEQAARDANLRFPAAASHFACALGVAISEQATPNLNMLLRRTLTDAGLSTYKAKVQYQRMRPFVAFDAPSCTPEDEPFLRKDGSYPSGHAALGWAWALVLTQAAPERADALLQRGRSYGQSRAVCGVHWKSDIQAGWLMGAATVARLQTNAVFQAQLSAAKVEIAKARAAGQIPAAADCAAEAQALGVSAKLAP
ncbi:MAG: phosphatase PAP2 family protein [Burkholderiaceae bacterium]